MTVKNAAGTGATTARRGAERILGAAGDGLLLLAVLAVSAFAVVTIALAAPVALALSAIAGAFAPKREARHWREAHAA